MDATTNHSDFVSRNSPLFVRLRVFIGINRVSTLINDEEDNSDEDHDGKSHGQGNCQNLMTIRMNWPNNTDIGLRYSLL